MYHSLQYLKVKSDYESLNAKLELTKRLENFIDTGLLGSNKEKLVYTNTEEIVSNLNYIKNNIKMVKEINLNKILIREALASATIEGANTTLNEVSKNLFSPITKDDKMVSNTYHALLKSLEVGVESYNIRSLWEVIVKDVGDNMDIAGDFYRNGGVYIGNAFRTVYIPPDPVTVPKMMSDLLTFKFNDSIIDAIITHFYFVYIHPFCDGNGRFARMWMLEKLTSDFSNEFLALPISETILNTVGNYYQALQMSEQSVMGYLDITFFVHYMLETIRVTISKILDSTL